MRSLSGVLGEHALVHEILTMGRLTDAGLRPNTVIRCRTKVRSAVSSQLHAVVPLSQPSLKGELSCRIEEVVLAEE